MLLCLFLQNLGKCGEDSIPCEHSYDNAEKVWKQSNLSATPSCVAITCFQNVSKCGEDSMPCEHYYNKMEKVQFSVVQVVDPGWLVLFFTLDYEWVPGECWWIHCTCNEWRRTLRSVRETETCKDPKERNNVCLENCIHLSSSSLFDRLLSVILVSRVILAPANSAMLDKVCGVVQRASLMWLWRDSPPEHPRRIGSSFFRRLPLWGSSSTQMLSSYWEWWSKTIRWGTEPHKQCINYHTKSQLHR